MLALPGPLTSSSPEVYRIRFHQGFLNVCSAPGTAQTMSSGPAVFVSFCLHSISMTKALSTPFFRGGDWSLRRESGLPQTTQPWSGSTRAQTHLFQGSVKLLNHSGWMCMCPRMWIKGTETGLWFSFLVTWLYAFSSLVVRSLDSTLVIRCCVTTYTHLVAGSNIHL